MSRTKSRYLYVGNLAPEVDEECLTYCLKKYGRVCGSTIHQKDKIRYAIVSFLNVPEAEAIIHCRVYLFDRRLSFYFKQYKSEVPAFILKEDVPIRNIKQKKEPFYSFDGTSDQPDDSISCQGETMDARLQIL
ncbi:hypothetical protein ACOME3_009939 [Neoechinorhynchus agilis]